jgi:hypothetical protein
MELEPNLLYWNGNELEHKLELEDMKFTYIRLDDRLFNKRSLGRLT